uniref:Uncharacterized protein n=1 Tax=Anguilla anguilla TaxID=7936 RepID=A0A0E9QNJ9_ANGAN
MKIRRWEGWQKTLLLSSVVSDTMKRLLQPKLSKLEYLNEKIGQSRKIRRHGGADSAKTNQSNREGN